MTRLRSARQAAPPAGSRCSASGAVQKVGSETYKNPDSSSLQKPFVAGFATMGRLQLSKDEDRDRDPEGTRTCHRLIHWLKAIYRGKYLSYNASKSARISDLIQIRIYARDRPNLVLLKLVK